MLYCIMACLIGSDCNSHFPWSSIRRTCTLSLELAGPEWWVLKRLACGDCCLSSPSQSLGRPPLLGTPKALHLPRHALMKPGRVVSPQGRDDSPSLITMHRRAIRMLHSSRISPGSPQKFPGLGLGVSHDTNGP